MHGDLLANVNNFDTTAPSTTLVYTVDELTRAVGETLIYTITIDSNTSGPLDITQVLPANTNNLSNVTFVQNITGGASGSSTLFGFGFQCHGWTNCYHHLSSRRGFGASAGTFIDHEIELLADGTSTVLAADEAPTVIVDAIPFSALQAGDKPVYVDVVGSVERLTRTPPSTNGTTTISSQGGSQTFELFPDLKSNSDLTTTSPQELRALRLGQS